MCCMCNEMYSILHVGVVHPSISSLCSPEHRLRFAADIRCFSPVSSFALCASHSLRLARLCSHSSQLSQTTMHLGGGARFQSCGRVNIGGVLRHSKRRAGRGRRAISNRFAGGPRQVEAEQQLARERRAEHQVRERHHWNTTALGLTESENSGQ